MSKCWKNGAYRLEATKLYFVRNTVSAKHRKMRSARSSFPPDKAGNIPEEVGTETEVLSMSEFSTV